MIYLLLSGSKPQYKTNIQKKTLNLEQNSVRNSGYFNNSNNSSSIISRLPNTNALPIKRRNYSKTTANNANTNISTPTSTSTLNSSKFNSRWYGANQARNTKIFSNLSTANSATQSKINSETKKIQGLSLVPKNNGSFEWVSKSNKRKQTKKNAAHNFQINPIIHINPRIIANIEQQPSISSNKSKSKIQESIQTKYKALGRNMSNMYVPSSKMHMSPSKYAADY